MSFKLISFFLHFVELFIACYSLLWLSAGLQRIIWRSRSADEFRAR